MSAKYEMDHKSKLIMTWGFLRGLASTLDSVIEDRINGFCEMMNFSELLEVKETKQGVTVSAVDLCKCGHARKEHLYCEGICRPMGIKCTCEKFKLKEGVG
jgi:hypothetical protein